MSVNILGTDQHFLAALCLPLLARFIAAILDVKGSEFNAQCDVAVY